MVVLAAGTVSYMKGNTEVNRRGRVEDNIEVPAALNKTNSILENITRTEKIAEMKKSQLLDSFVGEITVYVSCSSLTPPVISAVMAILCISRPCCFSSSVTSLWLGRLSCFKKSSKPPGPSFQDHFVFSLYQPMSSFSCCSDFC